MFRPTLLVMGYLNHIHATTSEQLALKNPEPITESFKDTVKYILLIASFGISSFFTISQGRSRFAQALVGGIIFIWLLAPLFANSSGSTVLTGASISAYLGGVIFHRFPRQIAPLSYILVAGSILALFFQGFFPDSQKTFIGLLVAVSGFLMVISSFLPSYLEEPFSKTLGILFFFAGVDSLQNFGILSNLKVVFRGAKNIEDIVENIFPQKNSQEQRVLLGTLMIFMPVFSWIIVVVSNFLHGDKLLKDLPKAIPRFPKPSAPKRP